MKFFFLLFTLLIISFSISAQSRKIKELEKQRKEMLNEISQTDKLLRETKKNTSTLLNRIKLISTQIASRKQVVSLLGQEIESLNVEQQAIENEVRGLEADLKNKQSDYAKAVEAVLRNRKNENKLLFILSGRSLSESYRRLRYLQDYSEQRSNQADEIKNKQQELKTKKEELTQAKAEKMALLKQREIEQENLKKEESNYQVEVKDAQSKQKDLQKILAEKRRQADQLNKKIEKLIADDIARQKKSSAKKAEANNSSGSKGNKDKSKTAESADDTENIKLSGSFAANKGKLPIPITGSYTITTQFGTHRHEQWHGVTTSSSGIDIRGRSGASARAVFDGIVTLVSQFPGYNNCVIIRHGDYYTFYSNIESLLVKKGDVVKTNQSLGKIYVDSDTGTSEMHFQLWQGTSKLNPEPWLKK